MIDDAIDRARSAFPAWSQTTVQFRVAIVRRFAELVLANRDRILDAIQADTGKARIGALDEVLDVIGVTSYYAGRATSLLADVRRAGAIPILTKTIERHVPIGLVGVITPWNYPFTLPVSDIIPAILAGNTVVLLPDAATPRSAQIAMELLTDAGLPADVVVSVSGGGRVHGPTLTERADFIMFTGSTATGRQVAARSAERLIGFSGELGGKNPLLVLDDADVTKAARGAVRASFGNSGQLCVSTERAYVHESVFDDFVARFVAATNDLVLGAGDDWTIDVGPQISATHADRVMAHIEDAVRQGATILAGGRRRPDIHPNFVEPTILSGVTESMELARNETFGPVVAVYPVASNAEAVERANDSDYGLNASVWSRSVHRELAHLIRCGTVTINEGFSASWASHAAPMGGMKSSGIGRRHGAAGLLKYTESQTIAEQRVVGIAPLRGQSNEQFGKFMTRAMGLLRRFR